MCGMGRALIAVAVSGVGIAVGLYSFEVARADQAFSFAGTSAAGGAALLGGGWASIAVGLAFWLRKPVSRFGPLIAAAGFAWFVLEWNNPGIGSALAFTVGLCLYAACPPLAGHAVLSYPSGRLASRAERAVLAVAYAGGALVLGLLPALLFDPRSQGCEQCPRNLLAIGNSGRAVEDLNRFGVYLGLASALALCILVLVKLVRATNAGRRPVWPVFAAGAAYLVLVAAAFGASLDRGLLWNGTLERRLWIGEAGALCVIALGAAFGVARARRARAAVARLVVDLAHSPPAGGLRAALAGIVGDPALVLGYPLDRSGQLVDAQGRPADLSGCGGRTTLAVGGRAVAMVGHAPGLLDDSQLVDEVTAAARLALENERLQAEVRAQLEELRASRARIIDAGDVERKRLERDLHDGAQQRLVALALSLRLVRSQLRSDAAPEPVAALAEADSELDSAISELRELAHGIFPTVLADAGLAVAVRALAEEGRVPIQIRGLPVDRFSPAVETAAYTVVAEAARVATGTVVVQGERRDNALVIEVETQDEGRALDRVTLEDRLGALDGSLRLDRSDSGRVTIRAELPCGS
jgi:signal transduction histidine kinase